MELRIGIADNPQPITVTLPDDADRDGVKASVQDAMAGSEAVLWLTDDSGREIAVAAARDHPRGDGPLGLASHRVRLRARRWSVSQSSHGPARRSTSAPSTICTA